MVHILGWKFYAVFVLAPTVLVAAIFFKLQPAETVIEFLMLFAKSGGIIAVVTLLLGNSRFFTSFMKCPPFRWMVPSISREWAGFVTTNFFDMAKKQHIALGDRVDTNPEISVRATIKINLFTSSMTLRSDNDYLISETISCRLSRASENTFQLAYVTDNHVPDPKETDEQRFYGSGVITFQGRKPEALAGVHWTNRKWKSGLNTAGTIKLTRL